MGCSQHSEGDKNLQNNRTHSHSGTSSHHRTTHTVAHHHIREPLTQWHIITSQNHSHSATSSHHRSTHTVAHNHITEPPTHWHIITEPLTQWHTITEPLTQWHTITSQNHSPSGTSSHHRTLKFSLWQLLWAQCDTFPQKWYQVAQEGSTVAQFTNYNVRVLEHCTRMWSVISVIYCQDHEWDYKQPWYIILKYGSLQRETMTTSKQENIF
jgi:hypothetical protein